MVALNVPWEGPLCFADSGDETYQIPQYINYSLKTNAHNIHLMHIQICSHEKNNKTNQYCKQLHYIPGCVYPQLYLKTVIRKSQALVGQPCQHTDWGQLQLHQMVDSNSLQYNSVLRFLGTHNKNLEQHFQHSIAGGSIKYLWKSSDASLWLFSDKSPLRIFRIMASSTKLRFIFLR